MTGWFEPNHQRLPRKCVEVHAAAHVDQKRFEVEVFGMRLAWKPALTPTAELPDHSEQLQTGRRERILRPSRTFGPSYCVSVDQCLQPFGQHGARNARDSTANVIEPMAVTQQLANDQQCPSAAEQFERPR